MKKRSHGPISARKSRSSLSSSSSSLILLVAVVANTVVSLLSCYSFSSSSWITTVEGAFTAVPTSRRHRPAAPIVLTRNSNHPLLPLSTSAADHHHRGDPRNQKKSHQLFVFDPLREHLMESSSTTTTTDITPTTTTTDITTTTTTTADTNTTTRGGNTSVTASWKSLRSAWSHSQKSAMTFLAAALIMASVLFAPLQEAMAAPSGGRMGGSFGGSNRQSYSSGRTSSYRSQGSYTRGFTQGYGTGYLSRPSVTVVPSIGGYGYGYGGYFGAPIVTSPGLTVVSRGPSIVDFLIFGFFATVLFRTFTSSMVMGDDDGVSTMISSSSLGPGVTVAQLSVAVRISNRKDPNNILSFLERLSRTASTDSRVGISNLVSQVALELLRQKRSIFAADTEFKHFRNDDNGAQRHFSSKAIQERSKFEKESTNRYGGVDYSSSDTTGVRGGMKKPLLPDFLDDDSSGVLSPRATNAVVTLIISIDGDSTKLPQINNMSDLEKALTRIATDVKVDDCLRSAEVLWTPDDPRDVLSDRDIYVDYPKLRNV